MGERGQRRNRKRSGAREARNAIKRTENGVEEKESTGCI